MPGLPPCHLVYIGGGRLLAALKGMAAERGLGDRVHFVPTVPLAELLAWTASADIGVQPIRNTCLNHLSTDSNKLFEYAMAGLPVVASDFPEIPPGGRAHDIGLLFDPETPGELAGGPRPARRRRGPARAARRQCARSARALSWEAQEAELVGLYERVLARSSAPAAEAGDGVVAEAPKGAGEGEAGAAGGLLPPESEPAPTRSRRAPRRGRSPRRPCGGARARGRSPGGVSTLPKRALS